MLSRRFGSSVQARVPRSVRHWQWQPHSSRQIRDVQAAGNWKPKSEALHHKLRIMSVNLLQVLSSPRFKRVWGLFRLGTKKGADTRTVPSQT
eukprot:3223009-Amphidinium_carterae.1